MTVLLPFKSASLSKLVLLSWVQLMEQEIWGYLLHIILWFSLYPLSQQILLFNFLIVIDHLLWPGTVFHTKTHILIISVPITITWIIFNSHFTTNLRQWKTLPKIMQKWVDKMQLGSREPGWSRAYD